MNGIPFLWLLSVREINRENFESRSRLYGNRSCVLHCLMLWASLSDLVFVRTSASLTGKFVSSKAQSD